MKTNKEKVTNKTGIMKTLIYPQNLDLETLYLNNGYSITIQKNMILRTLKIVSILTPTNYNSYRFNNQGYVYLSSRLKKKILGNYYSIFHKELIKCDNPIIEMASRYKVGEETKLYRLIPKYRKSKIEKFHYQEKNIKPKKHDFLSNQFQLHNLSFDKDVFTYLFNFYKELEKKMDNDKQKVLLKNYIGRNLCIIDDICNNDIFYGRSTSNNRYYSSITVLNRIIRPFILVNNKPLYSIDIKSSQPYILATIMDFNFFNNNNNKLYNYNSIYNNIGGIILFPRFLKRNILGIEEYRSISFEDDFYAHVLRQELKREPIPIERERLKQKTMQFLFFNNSNARKKSELKYLVNQFPSVNSFITSCLNIFKGRKFSFILQRAESLLVIDVVAKEFHEKFPNEPFFTLHDAIFTTKENSEYIYNLMRNRLKEHTGITPGLKLETPNMSVIPSEFDIDRITDKIMKRSKKLKDIFDGVEVFHSNIDITNEFLKNFDTKN
jgi:hypothetical protein